MAQSINDYLKSYGVDPNERYSNKKSNTSGSRRKSSSSDLYGGYNSLNELKEANRARYNAATANSTSISDYLKSNGAGNVGRYDNGTAGGTNVSSTSDVNPYDAYAERLQKEYDEQRDLIEKQNRLAVEQGVNRLNAQKNNINQSADDNARQAYIMHMQQKKALPQQLASQGVTGGATETANLGLASDYQNNVNTINQNRANSIQDIDNAIVDLQNTGDLNTVEQVLANNQAALAAYKEAFAQKQAYNQWATDFNANRSDTAWEQAYKDKAYKDSMAQQELENQWYEKKYDNEQEKEEKDRKLTQAKLMAEMGDFSGLKALGYDTTQLEKQWKADLAQKYANTSKSGNGDTLKTYRDIFNTAFAMMKDDGYTADDVSRFVWGQGLSEEDEKRMLSALGLLPEALTTNASTPVNDTSSNNISISPLSTEESVTTLEKSSQSKATDGKSYWQSVSDRAKERGKASYAIVLEDLWKKIK